MNATEKELESLRRDNDYFRETVKEKGDKCTHYQAELERIKMYHETELEKIKKQHEFILESKDKKRF